MQNLGLTFPFIQLNDMNNMALSEFMVWIKRAAQYNTEANARMNQLS